MNSHIIKYYNFQQIFTTINENTFGKSIRLPIPYAFEHKTRVLNITLFIYFSIKTFQNGWFLWKTLIHFYIINLIPKTSNKTSIIGWQFKIDIP